jgi:hypothetical protein
MLFRLLAAAALAATLGACGTPAKIDHLADPTIKQAATSRSIDLRRIVTKHGAGEHVGQLMAGLTCTGKGDLTTKAVNAEITDREILRIVYDELKAANYNMVGTPDDLFDDPARSRADYQLAGVISNIKSNVCFPLGGFGNFKSAKGEYALTVEWQVFSRERSGVIYSVTTSGTSKLETSADDGFRTLQLNALRQATKVLMADDGFRDAVARGSAPQSSRPRS